LIRPGVQALFFVRCAAEILRAAALAIGFD